MPRPIEYRSVPQVEPVTGSGTAWPLLDDALTEAVSDETSLPETIVTERLGDDSAERSSARWREAQRALHAPRGREPPPRMDDDGDDSAPTIAMIKPQPVAPGVAPTEVVAARRGTPLSPRGGPSAAALLALVVCVMGLLGLYALQDRLSLQRTHAEVAQALARGSAAALLQARERVQAALKDRPGDQALLAARARLLGALLVECGGTGDPDPDGKDPLLDEATAAARLVQTQTSADALAAQGYLALWRGDAEVAAGVAAALRGEAREPGLSDYFAGLLALYRGEAAAAVADLELSIRSDGPAEPIRAGHGGETGPAAAGRERPPLPDGRHPLRQVWRARALRELGQNEEARVALDAALRQQPDQPAALVEQAWLDALAAVPGTRPRAAQGLRALAESRLGLGRGPRAAAYLALAEVALLQPSPSYAAARQALLQARALRPAGDPVLLSRLAAASLLARDPGHAIEDARAVLLLWPTRAEARLILVRGLLQRGQAREALAELDRDTRSAAVIGREARSAAVMGLAEVLERGPAEDRMILRAEVLLALGRTAAARELLGELLAVVPAGKAAVTARLVLLRSLLQQGDLPAAQRVVKQIMAEHPEGEQRAQARLLWARLGLLQRPPLRDAALELLESVVAEAPDLIEARQQLGRLLSQLGRPAEAAVQLREALRLEQAAAAPGPSETQETGDSAQQGRQPSSE